MRLAKGMKPHRVTLNKFYNYPIDSAFRHTRLTARVMEFKAEIAARDKEIAEMHSLASCLTQLNLRRLVNQTSQH